jgi:hypothetical protein
MRALCESPQGEQSIAAPPFELPVVSFVVGSVAKVVGLWGVYADSLRHLTIFIAVCLLISIRIFPAALSSPPSPAPDFCICWRPGNHPAARSGDMCAPSRRATSGCGNYGACTPWHAHENMMFPLMVRRCILTIAGAPLPSVNLMWLSTVSNLALAITDFVLVVVAGHIRNMLMGNWFSGAFQLLIFPTYSPSSTCNLSFFPSTQLVANHSQPTHERNRLVPLLS